VSVTRTAYSTSTAIEQSIAVTRITLTGITNLVTAGVIPGDLLHVTLDTATVSRNGVYTVATVVSSSVLEVSASTPFPFVTETGNLTAEIRQSDDVTVRVAATALTGIATAASHNFDGTVPTTSASLVNYTTYRFPSDVGGGLFYWDNREPMICDQLYVNMNGVAGNVTLSLVNLDSTLTPISGEEVILETASLVTWLAFNESNFKVTVLPYQALKLVTTGTGAQLARAVASYERTFVR
jgi:hypothetical protein